MAKSHRRADRAGAAEGMHDRAQRHESTSELRENVNAPSPPPAKSEDPQKPKTAVNDRASAHDAALRRLNGSKAQKPATPKPTPGPVLVKAYPPPGEEDSSSAANKMLRSKRKPAIEPSDNLPPLSSFSFESILREIDNEINPSVDAIAEIFGRSKLSLADEYGSHLPPQGEVSFPASQGQNEVLEAIPNARLESVEEVPQGHARRQSLALVGQGASAGAKSGAVAATSTASVEPTAGSLPYEADVEAEKKASLLPYVLSWLRNSNARGEARSRRSSVDPRAAESLQRILGES